jgi:adenosylcobinamide-GDP ribazoletransferase
MKTNYMGYTPPKAFVTAVRTITILPIRGTETEKPTATLPWFPVVGLLLGVITWGVLALLQQFTTWSNGLAVIALGLSIILTRGLHLDGLADWADGFWGGWKRDRILEIMKDSSLGTFGTVALVLVLVAKWCSLSMLIEGGNLHWIILAMIISRAMQVDLAVMQPYARSEDGTGAAFIRNASRSEWEPAAWATLAGVLLFSAGTWQPILAFGVAIVICRTFGNWCKRKIGGVTGDILGATSELTETAVLMIGAALA